MKIRAVGAELFLADGRTDMTNMIVAFRNIANATKNCLHVIVFADGQNDDVDDCGRPLLPDVCRRIRQCVTSVVSPDGKSKCS